MAKRHLLIYDNDAYFAGIFAQRFRSNGWSVVVVETLEDAKNKCAKKIPDVLIADLKPLDDVLVFLQTLRNDTATKKILQIALTEFGDRQTMIKVLDAGADQYLLKGHFVPTEAVKKVKRLLEEKKEV